MAQSLGISRGTLREAFHQLLLMGLIEMKQGDGTYIRSVTPSMFMNTLSPALLMDKSSASELLEARLYIESDVAFLAAKNATREQIQGLRNILSDMKQYMATNNVEDFIKEDVEYHMLVAKCSQNRVLMKVVETIRDILYQFIADFFGAMPNTMQKAYYYHTIIFRSITQHDQAGAKKHMEAHLKSLIRRVNLSKGNQINPMPRGKEERGRLSLG